MKPTLIRTLLLAGCLVATAAAGRTRQDACSGASDPQDDMPVAVVTQPDAAPASVAQAAAEVAELLNAGDYRTLDRRYPALRDSLPPLLCDLSEALVHHTFNRPALSNGAIERLAANPDAEPGTVINLRILSFYNYRSMNDYAGAARCLRTLIGELPAGDAARPSLEAFARWMEAFRAWPATTVRRPDTDVAVPASIRAVGRGEHLLVDVTMNGVTMPFIFDTGCSGSNFVSQSAARRLGVRVLADSIPITGMITLPAMVGVADSLQIGAVTVLHPTFIVIPDELMQGMPGGLDAVLGSDAMNRLGTVRIEANRGRIVFPVAETPIPDDGPNMTFAGGQFYLWPRYAGAPIEFHFDTGNVKSTLTDSFYAAHRREVKRRGRRSTSTQGGFGGVKELKVYVLPDLPLTLADVPFALHDVTVNIREEGLAAEGGEMGSLGMDFLRAFDAVTIDFRRMFVQPENDRPTR